VVRDVTRTVDALTATLRAVVVDPAVLLFIVLAPIFYSLLYPQPYLQQRLDAVPVAVVDEDGSSLSREITRYVAGSPDIRLTAVVAGERSALEALGAGQIDGALILPNGLERKVHRRQQAVVAAAGNGAYFLLNQTALTGFAEATQAAGAQVSLRERLQDGASPAEARAAAQPLAFELRRLFNPQQGYANYVVPAVAVLIVHQTLFLGIGTFLATRRERRTAALPYPLAQFTGELLAFSAIGVCGMLYFEGIVMQFYDLPRGGNPWGTIAFSALFAPATVLFSMALGAFFDTRERAMQVWVFASPLLLFVSGYTWPPQSLPALLRIGRWLIPSTPGILGFTQLAQMGARWSEVTPEVLALALSIVLLALPAWWNVRRSLARPIS
jgi:ABC-2 type transport system permease protein